MLNPSFQGFSGCPHAARISGAKQGWRRMAGGNARLRGRARGLGPQKRGGASRGSGNSFLPKFRHNCTSPGPAPTVPTPTPFPACLLLTLGRAWATYPPGLPGSPAPGLRQRSLLSATAWVSMETRVQDRPAAPLGGSSATRSRQRRAEYLILGVLGPVQELLLSLLAG